MLDRKLNEVCWILHVDSNDKIHLEVQGMESVLVTDVVKKRPIWMINRPYPQLKLARRSHRNYGHSRK